MTDVRPPGIMLPWPDLDVALMTDLQHLIAEGVADPEELVTVVFYAAIGNDPMNEYDCFVQNLGQALDEDRTDDVETGAISQTEADTRESLFYSDQSVQMFEVLERLENHLKPYIGLIPNADDLVIDQVTIYPVGIYLDVYPSKPAQGRN
jgi:hypothetical protein